MKKYKLICILLVIILAGCWLITTQSFAFTPKQIYQKAGPGVVFVFASAGSKRGSVGTGSIIREDGFVITNAHVFKVKGSSKLVTNISIFLKPHRLTGSHKKDLSKGYKGKIVAYDIPLDLALVKMVGVDVPLTVVDFADSEEVGIGDQVYAIGHPEQGGLWSLTTGVISAYRKDYGGVRGKDLFQTDASINRGNSGGPLLNEDAKMVGINSLIARKAADGLTITDVNFSIKTNVALNWLNKKGYHFTMTKAASSEYGETSAKTPKKPEKKVEPNKVEPLKKKKKKEIVTEEPSKPEKKVKTEKLGTGKILTKRNPYKINELLDDMREMEDMMDEMREMIDDFKKKKKK
jgi:serine protease Do